MRVRITSGALGSRFIKTLPSLRPTSDLVRKALFDILGPRIADTDFVDLFAGSGAVGLEALSRGANHATFVDDNPHHIKLLKANIASLELEDQSSVRQSTTSHFVETNKKPFDIVFADPWYTDQIDITTWNSPHLLRPDGIVIVEHSVKNPPLYQPIFEILQQKTYGDTILTFYTRAD